MRSRPAPASRAKSARVSSKSSLETPVDEVPEALAGGGRDEGGDVEPLEAVVAEGDRALAARRPDPAQDRLQPDAVLVGGEDLDHRAGMALRLLGDGLGELFLNAACSSGVAARACRGRGLWIVQPIARSASQPRCSATRAPELGRHEGRHLLRGPDPAVVGRASSAAPAAPRASAGVSTVGAAPLPRRRSPRLDGPKAL